MTNAELDQLVAEARGVMGRITYGSVCSGIEAATAAWHPLGWEPAFLSEIDAFPRAVLSHHYPEVPLHGDFTTIQAGDYRPIDLLVGGTPCQSFSVAGLRGGLGDDRGNLALEYLRLADRLRPRWLVWENVPGVLSSNGGRDFGSILGGMGELGYGVAYRMLDAQFFGVAQRRRRVFVVGYFGDWRPAAAVLFERHSLSGNPAPRREAGKGFAHPVAPSLVSSGRGVGRTGETRGQDPVVAVPDISHCLNAGGMGRQDWETETFVAHALRGEGFDASEDGTGRGTPIVPVPFSIMPMNSGKDYKARAVDVAQPLMTSQVGGNQGGDVIVQPVAFDTTQITSAANFSNPQPGDPCHPLAAGAHAPAIAFTCKDYGGDAGEIAPTLRSMNFDGSHANGGGQVAVASTSAVRRLTPRECERLQGFPDDYTAIPWRGKPADQCPDGPRYKALGNSMAVPVMAWIGRRVEQVEAALQETTP